MHRTLHQFLHRQVRSFSAAEAAHVYFYQIPIFEIQSAIPLSPFVIFQQLSKRAVHHWVSFQPLYPVDEMSIIGTRCSSNLDMALNTRARVFPERHFFCPKGPPFSLVEQPVFSHNPCHVFVRVTALGPSPELVVEKCITRGKDLLTSHRAVVVGPSPYDGIEISNERFLGSGSEFLYLLCQCRRVFFDGLLTGCDDGFVAEWLPIRVLASVRFSYWKLPDGEAEKVKSYVPLMGFECVADFGLTRFQFQSHVLSPGGSDGMCFLDAFQPCGVFLLVGQI